MSYSLQLANGDFTASSAQLGTVTDVEKLTQDLRCCLLEPMGTDDMHFDYGSLIDGGTMSDGTVVAGAIGDTNLQQVAALVQSEIARIATAYQAQQLARAKADQATYNRISLSPAEALIALTDISMTQQADVLTVVVTLETGQGVSIAVVFPLTSNT